LIEVQPSSDLSISNSHEIEYFIEITELFVLISGGNRQSGYSSPLILEGVAKDLDVTEVDQESNIQVTWECNNLNLNSACTSILGDLLVFEANSRDQSFEEKLFEPFNSYMFTFSAEKSSVSKTGSNFAVIIIVDLDQP
jgi:hypothetical protein